MVGLELTKYLYMGNGDFSAVYEVRNQTRVNVGQHDTTRELNEGREIVWPTRASLSIEISRLLQRPGGPRYLTPHGIIFEVVTCVQQQWQVPPRQS